MLHLSRNACVIFAFVLLAVGVDAGPLASVERVVLDNGLVVLLLPEPGSGLVSVGTMYRVGAKNEAAGTTGLAHYAEHMNFRATARFPGHEITESVTRRGGRWTGYTWIDQTFYQTTLASEELSLALDLEADRMGGALYDEKDFALERESVIAELRSYDDPHALLYDEVLAAAFQIHPYRNNTIGWLTDVEAVTRDTAFQFYRRFYHPRNAVLVIGGDFTPAAALRAVRERFGSRPRGAEDAHVATLEPPQAGERRVTVRKPGGHAELLVAFRAPALTDPDFAAMVLFDALLAGGKGLWFLRDYTTPTGPPLQHHLVASGLATEARSAFQASLYPYVYTLRATTHAAIGLAAAEQALFETLGAAATREWSAAELRQARDEVRAGLARDLDTLAGRVHQLAFFEVAGGYEQLASIGSRLDALDATALRRFARERLTRDRATIGWFVPTPGVAAFSSGSAKPPLLEASKASASVIPQLRARTLPATTPAPSPVRLSNGLTLHVTPQPAAGLVALRGRIDAGLVYETAPGLSALAADLFALSTQGAGGPLALDLDDEPAAFGNARFIGFHGSGLPASLPALAGALARGFEAAASRTEDARRRSLERAGAAEADTDALLAARARAVLFAAPAPLSRPPWASAQTLAGLSASALEAFRARFLTPARTEVSVAAPLAAVEVRRALEAAFASASARRARSGLEPTPVLEPARGPAEWTVVRVLRPDASQSTIQVAWPGDRGRPHDAAATSLLLYLLGETYYSGRLGRALVEPGLVYSVWTTLEEAAGVPGYLLVRTAASRENTPEALRRIRGVLEEAARGAFTAPELKEAKTYLRGKQARSRDGALNAAAQALLAAPALPSAQDVTLDQLNDTARRLFARGAPTAFVAGPGE